MSCANTDPALVIPGMHAARNAPGTLQKPDRKYSGSPDEYLKIVLICQPPASTLVMPPWFRYFLP